MENKKTEIETNGSEDKGLQEFKDILREPKAHRDGPTIIHISQVPAKTKQQFIELASKDFLDHFGFTLKFLMDFYNGTLEGLNQEVKADIAILAARIGKIEEDKEAKYGSSD